MSSEHRLTPQKRVYRFLLEPDETQQVWLDEFVRDMRYLTNIALRVVNRKFRRAFSAYTLGHEFRNDLDVELQKPKLMTLTPLSKSVYLESVMEKMAAMFKEPVLKQETAHVREGAARITEREPGRFFLSLTHPQERGARVEIPIQAGRGEGRREPVLSRLKEIQGGDLKAFEIIRRWRRHGGVRYYLHATVNSAGEIAPDIGRVMGVWLGYSRFLAMAVITEPEPDNGGIRVVGDVHSVPAGPLRDLKHKHRRHKETVRGLLGVEARRIAVQARTDGCAFVVLPEFDMTAIRQKAGPGGGPQWQRVARRALTQFEYEVFGQAIESACFDYGVPVRRLSAIGMKNACPKCHSNGDVDGAVFRCGRCGAQRDSMFVGAFNLALAVHHDLRKAGAGSGILQPAVEEPPQPS